MKARIPEAGAFEKLCFGIRPSDGECGRAATISVFLQSGLETLLFMCTHKNS